MQFNPACLQGSGNMSSTNTATMATTPAEFANNPNPSTAYPDGPPQTGNPWAQQGSVLGLPVYGIYNASLIPVPEAVPNQASDNAPAIAKKKSAKRSPQQKSGDNMVLDESAKAEDRFQGLDEEQKLKRQRRLIKNREAAQQFRQRQKEYIQNLERRVTELNTHVGETHKHIELLTAENRLLRDQLVYLYNVMRQNLSLTTPPPLSPTAASSPSPFTSAMSSVPPSPSIPPTPPPSPISPFPSGVSIPATNMSAALSSPTQMLDLSMLGFKGYNMMSDGSISYEMLKATTTAQGMTQNIPQQNIQNIPQNITQNLQQQNLNHTLAQNLQALQNIQNMNQSAQHLQQMTLATPTSSAQNSPVPTTSSPPSHLSNIPDLGTLKLDMDNAMLLSRYSKASDLNEAQTVPVFVKSEGTASL